MHTADNHDNSDQDKVNGFNPQESQSHGSCDIKIEEGISFAWSDLNVSTEPVSESKCLGLTCKSAKPVKHILKNVSGLAKPGEVLAIMGASGAGKSTLLNTLLFRHTEGLNISGTRMANGEVVSPGSLTSVSAYVQQEDLFIPSLTVREHLTFQSRVRMDRELSRKERLERVNEAIRQVGLQKAENVLIGDDKIKGISGGEKKRLSFASEFLTNPSLLFCDEPTSGLDSFMAMSIMDLMNNLAKSGKTIICTIHQPSSQIFNQFDKLLLMAEGQTAYLGPAAEAKPYFTTINYPCPEDFNPADHFVYTLAVIPGQEEESTQRVNSICDEYSKSKFAQNVRSEIKEMETMADADDNRSKTGTSLYKASWFEQFAALAWRQAISILRNPLMARVKILMAIIIGLILGVIYQSQELDQAGIQNVNGAIFVIVTNLSFGSIFGICNSYCLEIPVFLREHINGMYRTDTFFLAKQLVETPLYVLEASIMFSIIYWIAGLNPEAERFFIALGIVILILQVINSLGFFLSSISPNADFALAIAPVLIIPMMLFGGFYLNTESVVDWLIWIRYISWFYYGYSALLVNQWSGVENISCPQKISETMGGTNMTGVETACLTTGDQVLATLSIHESNFTRDILLLVTLAIVLRILAFLALLMRTRRK